MKCHHCGGALSTAPMVQAIRTMEAADKLVDALDAMLAVYRLGAHHRGASTSERVLKARKRFNYLMQNAGMRPHPAFCSCPESRDGEACPTTPPITPKKRTEGGR